MLRDLGARHNGRRGFCLTMLPQPSLERARGSGACFEVLCLMWFLIWCVRGVQTTWSWAPRAVSTSGCLRCPSRTLVTRTSSRPRPPRSKLPFEFLIINWDTQRSVSRVSRLLRKKETGSHAEADARHASTDTQTPNGAPIRSALPPGVEGNCGLKWDTGGSYSTATVRNSTARKPLHIRTQL